MRTSWILTFVLCVLALGFTRAEAQTKIGFVNTEVILQTYPETAKAEQTYRADVENWNREAQARKRDLDQSAQQLAQQGPMLSDEKRREKEDDYQKKVSDYDTFVQGIWGPNGLVVQRNEEILRPIIERIQTILTTIGEEQGFSLILDAADGNILYADPSLDLTQEVLNELNVHLPDENQPNEESN